jgi:lathosterol oxidase
MDIVLEVADTFLFDHIYSTILPSCHPQEANATLSSTNHEPTGFVMPVVTWQYEPASEYFSIQPSQAAYESAWSRDDWRRQLLTLYLITWYSQERSPNMHTYR